MKKQSILIVGAGPVGLSGAWFLSLIPNLQVRIVQKQQFNYRQVLSKALSINPRTMEFFKKTPIQQEFLINSLKVTKMKLSTKDKTIIQADISDSVSGKTNFPQLHILPQTMTQRTIQCELNKKNIFVQRQIQVLDVKNQMNANSHKVWVQMRDNKNGNVSYQQFDYLLATDGAHSTIRKMFGLKFQGQTLPTSMYLCDAQIQGTFSGEIQTIIDDKNYLVIIPIKQNHVRIMGNSPDYLKNIPTDKFSIVKISWRSEFLINNRFIQKMSTGNVYFAGDAAHVHAPLGNRGMNLGIQDVYIFANLLKKNKVEKYHQIRHQMVKQFVNKVNQLSKKMVTFDNTWEKKLLPYFGSIFGRIKKNEAILFVTGLDHKIPNFAKL